MAQKHKHDTHAKPKAKPAPKAQPEADDRTPAGKKPLKVRRSTATPPPDFGFFLLRDLPDDLDDRIVPPEHVEHPTPARMASLAMKKDRERLMGLPPKGTPAPVMGPADEDEEDWDEDSLTPRPDYKTYRELLEAACCGETWFQIEFPGHPACILAAPDDREAMRRYMKAAGMSAVAPGVQYTCSPWEPPEPEDDDMADSPKKGGKKSAKEPSGGKKGKKTTGEELAPNKGPSPTPGGGSLTPSHQGLPPESPAGGSPPPPGEDPLNSFDNVVEDKD